MNHVMRPGQWLRLLRRTPGKLLLAALVGLAAGRNLTPTVSVVDGISMAPTLQPESRISAKPVSNPLHRGDIVLVQDPQGERVVKRILGLPSERMEFCRGYVFINGRLLREPYLPAYTFTFLPEFAASRHILGPNEYFLMGDNREFSLDSRNYGAVSRERILMLVTGHEPAENAWLDQFRVAESGSRWIEPSP